MLGHRRGVEGRWAGFCSVRLRRGTSCVGGRVRRRGGRRREYRGRRRRVRIAKDAECPDERIEVRLWRLDIRGR